MAEYLQHTRRIVLGATGGGQDVATVVLEVGIPYRNYTAWVHIGDAENVTAQPLFAEQNDGASTLVNTAGMRKVFQVPAEELRPATQLQKNSADAAPAYGPKSALRLTNNAATPVTVSVYLLAVAAQGGI